MGRRLHSKSNMQPGQIVFKGKSKDDQDFIIRYPKIEDTEQLLEFINTLSQEQTFISLQGEQFTLEEEKKVVEEWLKNMSDKVGVSLLAFIGDEVVGSSGITLHKRMGKHIGEFGIVVAKDFRNQGVGKKLMEKVMSEAEKNLEGLKIIKLGCFGINEVALNLYKEMGFVEYGRLPGGLNYKDQFIDDVKMYKKMN